MTTLTDAINNYTQQVSALLAAVSTRKSQLDTAVEAAVSGMVPLRQYASTADSDCAAGLTAALATGRPVLVPAGTWHFTSSVTLPANASLLMAPGAVLDFSSAPASTTLLTATGTESAAVALIANVARKATTVSVASTSGFVVGGLVRLCSNALFDAYSTFSKVGEILRVKSIGSGTLTFETALCDSYAVADGATVSAITPVTGIRIRGGKIKGGGQGCNHKGISVFLGDAPKIEDVEFEDVDERSIWLRDTPNFRVWSCKFRSAHHASTGYGVSVDNACHDGQVMGCTSDDVRHLFTTNNSTNTKGIPRRILVAFNVARCSATSTGGVGGDAFDTHTAAEDIWFEHNHAHSASGAGFNVECPSARLIGNKVFGAAEDGIRVHNESDRPGHVAVLKNEVRDVVKDGIQVIRGYRGTLAQYRSVKVDENEVYDVGAVGIYINTPAGSGGRNNAVSVNNNTLIGVGSTVASIYLESTYSGTVNGNVISAWTVLTAGGIRLKDCKDIAVTGGTITGPDGAGTCYGVYLQGTTPGATSDIVVQGMRFVNTGTGVMRGIYLDDNTANCRIDENDYLGTAIDINNGAGTGHTIQFPIVSMSYTLPLITAGSNDRQLITLSGAKRGDILEVSSDLDLQGMVLSASVSNTNQARVQVQNITGANLTLGAGTLRIRRRRVGN